MITLVILKTWIVSVLLQLTISMSCDQNQGHPSSIIKPIAFIVCLYISSISFSPFSLFLLVFLFSYSLLISPTFPSVICFLLNYISDHQHGISLEAAHAITVNDVVHVVVTILSFLLLMLMLLFCPTSFSSFETLKVKGLQIGVGIKITQISDTYILY